MTQVRPRGPYAKTAARRQAIVRAAREAFVARGVDGASLRDIALRAGITHAGLLHHFDSKDELVVEVLRQRDEAEAERGRLRAQSSPTPPAGPFLVGLLREHQEAPELVRLWGELTASASREGHPAHAYFVERYATARAHFTEHVEREAEPGSPARALGPEAAAAVLTAVMDGLQAQWLLDPALPIDELLARFLEVLMQAPA